VKGATAALVRPRATLLGSGCGGCFSLDSLGIWETRSHNGAPLKSPEGAAKEARNDRPAIEVAATHDVCNARTLLRRRRRRSQYSAVHKPEHAKRDYLADQFARLEVHPAAFPLGSLCSDHEQASAQTMVSCLRLSTASAKRCSGQRRGSRRSKGGLTRNTEPAQASTSSGPSSCPRAPAWPGR
jgi:hypothetical protein